MIHETANLVVLVFSPCRKRQKSCESYPPHFVACDSFFFADWYAGVPACDLNTNLTNYTNAFFVYELTRISRMLILSTN